MVSVIIKNFVLLFLLINHFVVGFSSLEKKKLIQEKLSILVLRSPKLLHLFVIVKIKNANMTNKFSA